MINWIISQIVSRLFESYQSTLRGLLILLGGFLANYGITLQPSFYERVIGWVTILAVGLQQILSGKKEVKAGETK
jgi:hypothetical protein